MFPDLMLLVFAFAVCFGIQHKVPFLHGKFDLLDKMLECTYCTGFHAGWIVWVMTWGASASVPADTFLLNFYSVISWSFISSIFCYCADTLLKWVEFNSESDFSDEEDDNDQQES